MNKKSIYWIVSIISLTLVVSITDPSLFYKKFGLYIIILSGTVYLTY